jgi:arylsulfatase A-like enzyme
MFYIDSREERKMTMNGFSTKPNLIYILADDMGIGDVSCYNERSAWQTPHLDRFAREGMRFDDAHSSSAVCTPSRYSILTGRYAWRSWLKRGVVGGFTPSLLEPGRMTVASYLRDCGYQTACVGKWHLGLDWVKTGKEDYEVDYSQPFGGGPCDFGFDTWLGISASLDMAPYVYLRDRRVEQVPDRIDPGCDEERICYHESKRFWREGAIAPNFVHEEVMPRCTDECVSLIREKRENPFFIYYALPAPHTPVLPTAEFAGKTGTTSYGDFCAMVDAEVGRILAALDETGQAENTIVIFTSDNGCSPRADYVELGMFGHHPSLFYRGAKADIFEGGHRIPLLTRWPEGIAAGGVTDETVCLSDLLATMAEVCGEALPACAGEDSVSLLPVWRQESLSHPLREATVHHAIDGSFSIRQGRWKLELCPGSGGWSYPRNDRTDVEGMPLMQLYDLETDIRERINLVDQHPEVVESLKTLLTHYVVEGRSTPGEAQLNHHEQGNNWDELWWMNGLSGINRLWV